MASYSIHQQFSGGSVLITGASGYVGGLVVEKLLRCTGIDTVYVLMRAKKGSDIQTRLSSMLNSSPLFHLLRDNPVLSKVKAIEGDMRAAPQLGIFSKDLQLLQQTVHTVIHCAADIRLEIGIHELLTTNYAGTRQLLQLSRTFPRLSAFVHVSSAYTNINRPQGSLVQEAIYQLGYGDQPVVAAELVQELLSMPAHNANLRAEGLLAAWGFPNNYTLSKHLAEYMVAEHQAQFNLPVAIVRPTLISSVARDPYPGYTGNYAGHVGATLAFMAGLFDSPAASNYKGSHVWDVIPSDVVANVILASAAALGQRVAGRCCASPTHITACSNNSNSRPSLSAQSPQSPRAMTAVSSKGIASSKTASGAAAASGTAAAREGLQEAAGQQQQHGTLLIVHVGSSTTYPLSIMESWNWGVETYGAWPMVPNLVWGRCAGPMEPSHTVNPSRAAAHMALTSWKIWLAAKMLGLFKMAPVARKLQVGFESFKVINQPKTDVNLRFSSVNMQRLAGLLEPAEQGEFLLLWRPQAAVLRSSSGVPSGLRIRCPFGSNDPSVKGLSPRAAAVKGLGTPLSPNRSSMLSTPTKKSQQQQLSKLMGASSPTPQPDFTIMAALPGSNDGRSGSNDGRSNGSNGGEELLIKAALPGSNGGGSNGSSSRGAQLSEASAAAVARMRAIPVEWRLFHINLGAFLYTNLFKMPLPAAEMPISKPEVVRWLKIQPADQTIRHQFVLYK